MLVKVFSKGSQSARTLIHFAKCNDSTNTSRQALGAKTPRCRRCFCLSSQVSVGPQSACKNATDSGDCEVNKVQRLTPATGGIEIIIGPMFAGKTSALLRRIADFEALHKRVMAIKSEKDVRYGTSRINTHSGASRICYALSRLSQVRSQWSSDYEAAEVIAIDEAQFFPDLQEFCCNAANEDNKQVIVAGLDGDFQRQKFGQILDLIPQADSVTKLVSRCSYCEAAGRQTSALFSLRIAADERQEVVGGADKYAPVCRHHYKILSELRHRDTQEIAAGS